MTEPLFRQQAVDARQSFSLGNVSLHHLPHSGIITTSILIFIIALLIFICVGEYSKKSTVAGYLFPEKGVSNLKADIEGIVGELYVHEGSLVKKGQRLVLIRPQISSGEANNINDLIAESLQKKREIIDDEVDAVEEQKKQSLASFSFSVLSLRKEKESLEKEIALSEKQIDVQNTLHEKYKQLAEKGFVSELEVQKSYKDLLSLRMLKVNLEGRLVSLNRDIQNSNTNALSSQYQFDEKLSGIEQKTSGYDQEINYQKGSSERLIVAAADGYITNVLVYNDQFVNANQPLLTLIPENSSIQALLQIPSASAGLIKQHQQVKLRIAAFPHQKYGTFDGEVKSISTAIISGDVNSPAKGGFYLAVVTLLNQQIKVDEHTYSLKSGMQLDADIVVDRRTIIEWILEPILNIIKKV